MKHIISIIIFAIISMVAKAQPCINSEANADMGRFCPVLVSF